MDAVRDEIRREERCRRVWDRCNRAVAFKSTSGGYSCSSSPLIRLRSEFAPVFREGVGGERPGYGDMVGRVTCGFCVGWGVIHEASPPGKLSDDF